MRIIEEEQFGFDDLMFQQQETKHSSRDLVDLKREFSFLHAKGLHIYTPIIASNMDGVGTYAMANAFKDFAENPDYKGDILTAAITKGYSNPQFGNPVEFYTNMYNNLGNTHQWYTIGIAEKERNLMLKIAEQLPSDKGINKICIDIAQGGLVNLQERVRDVRAQFKDAVIMAGNVSTPELTKKLIDAGADIIKIGIGPGSVCTTRSMTGVGRPQASAIIECAESAHSMGAHICADGGMKTPGDMAKAFALGADFLMLGGYLSGHQEGVGSHQTCEFSITEKDNGAKFVQFHGMSSKEAQDKHSGGIKSHRGSEGKSVDVPFKGDVEHTMRITLNNIRSAGTYIDADRLEDYHKKAVFYKVREQLNPMFN